MHIYHNVEKRLLGKRRKEALQGDRKWVIEVSEYV